MRKVFHALHEFRHFARTHHSVLIFVMIVVGIVCIAIGISEARDPNAKT